MFWKLDHTSCNILSLAFFIWYIFPNIHLGAKWVKSLSHVRFFATPWAVAYQAPLSMGFSRQYYWSGLPFPSPADLLTQGLNHIVDRRFTVWATREVIQVPIVHLLLLLSGISWYICTTVLFFKSFAHWKISVVVLFGDIKNKANICTPIQVLFVWGDSKCSFLWDKYPGVNYCIVCSCTFSIF